MQFVFMANSNATVKIERNWKKRIKRRNIDTVYKNGKKSHNNYHHEKEKGYFLNHEELK